MQVFLQSQKKDDDKIYHKRVHRLAQFSTPENKAMTATAQMLMEYNDTLNTNCFQRTEVSKMEWKNYKECMNSIRPYNIEKKRVITNIHNCLQNYHLFVN